MWYTDISSAMRRDAERLLCIKRHADAMVPDFPQWHIEGAIHNDMGKGRDSAER